MKRIIGVWVSVWILVAGAAAATADEASAKKAFRLGLEKLKAEDFAGAAEQFEASFNDVPRSNTLINLAQCFFKLGRHMESLSAFQRVKSEFEGKLTESDLAEVNAKIQENQKKLPSVRVVCDQEGSTVTIDGRPVGKTPMSEPVFFEAGAHSIEVSKEGFQTEAWKSEYTPGLHDERSLTMKPLAEPPEPKPAVEPVPTKPAEESKPMPTAPTDKRRDTIWSPLFITGLSGTIVMAGVSTGLWAASFHQRSEYESKNDEVKGMTEEDPKLIKDRDDAKSASKNYNKAAIATTAVTGAFAVLTVTAVILHATKKKETPVTLLPGAVEVRF